MYGPAVLIPVCRHLVPPIITDSLATVNRSHTVTSDSDPVLREQLLQLALKKFTDHIDRVIGTDADRDVEYSTLLGLVNN